MLAVSLVFPNPPCQRKVISNNTNYTLAAVMGTTAWKQLRAKRDGRKIEMQSIVYSDQETSSDFVNYEILDEWESKDHGVLLLGEKAPFYVWSWSFRPCLCLRMRQSR